MDKELRRAVVWTFDTGQDRPGERAALAAELPYFGLPEDWEDMTQDELRRFGIRLANERRTLERKPQTEWVPGVAKAEPDYPEGWIQSEKSYASALDFDDECPCCGDVIYHEGWHDDGNEYTCPSCGYNPEISYTLLPTVERPASSWGTRHGGMRTYRDSDLAASMVTYHEGEPVLALEDEDPIDEWNYPASWDRLAQEVPHHAVTEGRARTAGGNYPLRKERIVEMMLESVLDCTVVG